MTATQCASSAAEHARQGVAVLNGCSDPDLIAYRVLLELVEGVLCDWLFDEACYEDAYVSCPDGVAANPQDIPY